MKWQKNILLTGRPGIGKTTLIRRLAEDLGRYRPEGFYTAEIRKEGIRKGFELIGLQGGRLVLSHVDFSGTYRVGKYGVDIEGFDKYLRQYDFVASKGNLVIIDEIGKMECHSRLFVDMITRLLGSEKTVVASIAQKGGGSFGSFKDRFDITLLEVTAGNRDSLPDQIAAAIMHIL